MKTLVARKEAPAALTALRKQCNEVAEWYGGLKYRSGNAWKDVKKGLLHSYLELRDIFDKVPSEGWPIHKQRLLWP